ncbi:MAG TPA: hypothetical protein PKD00_01310 [Burkholderiales bacterium]|nr:hypothetical protein [Burkholderiales bacterium]
MKKLLILTVLLLTIISCYDVSESRAKLSSEIGTNNIYSIDKTNHIVYSDTSVYHYKTTESGKVIYMFKIK